MSTRLTVWPAAWPNARPVGVCADQRDEDSSSDGLAASQELDIVRILTPVEDEDRVKRGRTVHQTSIVNRHAPGSATSRLTNDG